MKVIRFLRRYRLFSLAIVASIVGGILELTDFTFAAQILLSTVAIIAALPLLWNMWHDIRSGHYGIDILAVTAIVTAVILQEYWAAIIVVVMLTGGEALEDYAERRAHAELTALLARAPQKAHVMRGRKTFDVEVNKVRIGDKIIIKPGEVVPVDATILEGTASFDESSLTGESLPQAKKQNDQILSGSINVDGAITAKAVHTAADSQYEQIIKLVQSAASSQAPFIRLADRYSIPFTIIAYVIAGGVWIASGDPIRFLQVIIVATPCPLLLAAPIALVSGMSRASKHGIIVKTGSALEKLAEAKTIAFDKTGTLTRGELSVDSITTFKRFTKPQILELAASLEQNSNHILAHAIMAEATKKKIKFATAKQVQERAGHGLKATLSGKEVLVGHYGFMETSKVSMPPAFKRTNIQQTAAYIAVEGELAGIITFKDELRAESKQTLGLLKSLGFKHMLMLTGDHTAAAKSIAKKLGIKDFQAEALPGDKLRAVEALTNRPVVFVGDGVNDAPVLMAADVGIALGARGSTAASESADVVILQDDLGQVARATAIAQRTFKIARQSIFIGIGISVGLMLLFATGKFSPVMGALLQEVVDVIIIFNALRAHIGNDELS